MCKEIADLLYKDVKDASFYLSKKRIAKDGQEIVRIGPSPTGFFHIGGIYQALINKNVAEQSKNGVFYLRIEDTDKKREVDDAANLVFKMLTKFDLKSNEGFVENGIEVGEYGPYMQSQRTEIYNSFAKYLVEKGCAYPCFCEKTESHEEVVEKREAMLENSGDVKVDDPCRCLSFDEIKQNLEQGKKFALRLKSKQEDKKIVVVDKIKGKRELPANTKDVVLIKNNGIPVYAFAHAVDDTLMGTTTVIRGEEWFNSLPCHIEIFEMLDFPAMQYAHTPVVCKLDSETNSKRKLSKRYDKEANCEWFLEQGIPVYAIKEYLTNLINSDFETYKHAAPENTLENFNFSLSKIGNNSPVFDLVKLYDYSKNFISEMTAKTLFENLLTYSNEYDKDFALYLENNREYVTKVLNIERENVKKRKDIACYSEIKTYFYYMFNNDFEYELENVNTADFAFVADFYKNNFTFINDKQEWFNEIKSFCDKTNFATDNKAYKANPENYKGNTAKFCEYVRLAITGRKNSVDICEIMQVLGKQEVEDRLNKVVELYGN